jgi:signal transduction histidine kinase/ActR/RegA family two-component response regulator
VTIRPKGADHRRELRIRLAALSGVVAVVAVLTAGISLWMLYSTALESQRDRLREIAQGRARMMEAVGHHDMALAEVVGPPAGFSDPAEATLAQFRQAHEGFEGFGETGEFTLAQREGDEIAFVLHHRHPGSKDRVSFDSELAEPMRRALSGESGTLIGLDYRGVKVLAAHEPVGFLGLGIVAKIDLAEVRAPFVRAASVCLGVALVLAFVASLAVVALWRPVAEGLVRSEASLDLALQAAGMGLWGQEPGQAFRWDSQTAGLFGVAVDDAPTNLDGFLSLVAKDDRKETELALGRAMRAQRGFDLEFRVRDTEETVDRVLAVRGQGVRDGLVGVCWDVSEQHRAAEEKEHLEEKLRQSQKMEAIGRLAGGVAHDFNNILLAILNNAELMEIRLPGNPALRYVAAIREAAERAADLTRQLLAFGRKQMLQPQAVDLNESVTEVDKILRRTIGEDIEIRILRDPDLGMVMVDPGQIHQVILNLAVNARDAMPTGGALTIETTNVVLDEEYVRIRPEIEPGRYVMLAVSDTGVGMSPEVQERVFEPFFTTKSKDKGTGLGLSTVYGIVRQTGGSIGVYSEPGVGSTFKVFLPRAMDVEDDDSATASGVLWKVEGTERLLLVEDDASVRESLVEHLERFGYQVVAAGSAEEAIVRAAEVSFDALITDVVLPKESGAKLAERLLLKMPKLSVLFISGYTENAVVHHGVVDPDVRFLQKPFTPHQLGAAVRAVLDARANV